VFENRVLRKIFAPKGKDLIGGGRRLRVFENRVLRKIFEPKGK
jgi:hypothetical protein